MQFYPCRDLSVSDGCSHNEWERDATPRVESGHPRSRASYSDDDLARPLALDLGQGAHNVHLVTDRNVLALGEVDEHPVVGATICILNFNEVVDVAQLDGLLLAQTDHRDGNRSRQGDVLALLDLDLGGGGGGRGLEADLHGRSFLLRRA